jgi:lipoprotein Spr
MKRLVFLLLCCSHSLFAQQSSPVFFYPEDDFITSYRKSYLSQELGIPLEKHAHLPLYDTIVCWLGTPYKFAGNGEKGIDCSGFVNMLSQNVYGINLGARNSAEIYASLFKLEKDEIKEGDLVFFRIQRKRISHVGLYLGNNKFVHSSTSRGVIISDLNEPYYKRYFTGGGRFKNETAVHE